MRREHVATTVFYRRLIHALAGFFDCEPEEETVLAARMQWDKAELIGAMLRAADAEALLIDTGYPPPEEVLPGAELERLGGCRTEPMLRLETLMERLAAEHGSLGEVREALSPNWKTCGAGGTWHSRASLPIGQDWIFGSGRGRRRRLRCSSSGEPRGREPGV